MATEEKKTEEQENSSDHTDPYWRRLQQERENSEHDLRDFANAMVRRVIRGREHQGDDPIIPLLDSYSSDNDGDNILVSVVVSRQSSVASDNEEDNDEPLQNSPVVSPSPLSFRRDQLFSPYSSNELNTKERDIILNACALCGDYTTFPKVTLHCKCVYHLKCFKLLENQEKCVGCDDIVYKENDNDYRKCSICLNLLKQNITKMTCKHTFHTDCINSWRYSANNNRNKCPICRAYMT